MFTSVSGGACKLDVRCHLGRLAKGNRGEGGHRDQRTVWVRVHMVPTVPTWIELGVCVDCPKMLSVGSHVGWPGKVKYTNWYLPYTELISSDAQYTTTRKPGKGVTWGVIYPHTPIEHFKINISQIFHKRYNPAINSHQQQQKQLRWRRLQIYGDCRGANVCHVATLLCLHCHTWSLALAERAFELISSLPSRPWEVDG